MNPIFYCNFTGAHSIFFGPDVPPIIYYSHIPIAILTLLLGVYILFQNRRNLSNNILFFTLLAFIAWLGFDLAFWASNRSDVIMFVWSMDVLVEPLVYIGSLYLLYTLIEQKDISFKIKLIWFVIYLPIALTLASHFDLTGFDGGNCLANEGFIAHYYTYGLEIIISLWVIFYGVYKFITTKAAEMRAKVFYLTIGVILFLLAFGFGNITGSFTDNWQLGEYGLFGMPIFTAFLVYSIVRFKAFNLRLVGAVALVIGLCALTFSLIFVTNIKILEPIAIITFILALIFGTILIRSVNAEARQLERIQRLAGDLEKANDQQVVLIHFITHQLKGFVTKSRNIFSLLMEGDYGVLPDTMRPMVEEGFKSDTKGAETIQEILNAANIKSGKVTYAMAPFDLKALIESIANDLKTNAEKKGLQLNLNLGDALEYNGDKAQLQNALKNLIDNSIKYTPSGSVEVDLKKEADKVHFEIKDTGVGITPEDMKNLFTEGGHGKESQKINVESTGFGLYIVKNIIEGHGGKVWAESEGAGKGSRFIVELPLAQEQKEAMAA